MKKSFRIIALLLAIILISVSLCSCEWLEEKKNARGVYSDDKREITYQDNVYRLVIAGKYDFIVFENNWNGILQYATAKDIPVLLADIFGDSMSVLNDGTVLRVNALPSAISEEIGSEVESYDASYTYSNYYYIRSDKYDEVKATINNAALDHYYFEYWTYDDVDYSTDMLNESRHDDFGWVQVMLNDDLTEVVKNALEAPANDMISYQELSTGDDSVYSIELSVCDKNMVLSQDGINYYLIQDGDRYYFWDGNYYQEYSIYPLPEKDAASVKSLFEKYPDAANTGDIVWRFENLNYYNSDSDMPKMGY